MADLTRRSLVGSTTAGLAGLGLIGSAQAAEPTPDAAAEQQPRALFGSVSGDRVTLPPLDNKTDLAGPTPNTLPPGKRLGIALVGLGHLSLGQILPGFAQAREVRVTALVSGERDKARAIAAQHDIPEKNIYDYGNFDSLKNNQDVDIVYIVLPNAMHAEFTIRAAQAGKHVLCEKPMATNVVDAQHMIEACRAAGRKLMIAYRCQYLPEYRTLIGMVRRQEFGQLRMIEACNGQDNADNGQWRHIKALAGGGSLPDVGLYCLNAARFLTGEEPIEVTGRITRPTNDNRFREVEDICAFTLRFPSGVVAACTSGYSFHENRSLRLMGSEATVGMDPAFSYDNLVMRIARRNGMSNAMEERRWSPKNQFALEMDAYARAISDNRTPLTPGEEGLQDHKIMQAIYQSAAGGSPVKLPAAEKLDATRGPAPEEGS